MTSEEPRSTPPPLIEEPQPEVVPVVTVLTDVVTGLNTRKSDNRFQAIAVGIGAGLGAVAGLIWGFFSDKSHPENIYIFGGIGLLAGMLLALLVSGAILGFYRLNRH